MKPRINIIVIFVLLFILAENLLAQNVFGPQVPNYIREIIKTGPENGSGPVVSYLQLLNGTCIIGKSTVNNETYFGRAIIQWNIPDNIIPDNSTINSVRLYLAYTKNGHSIELAAQFSSLPLDIQNLTQAQNEQLWQLMSTMGIGYKTGVNNVLEFISNNPNDDFNLAVKNALVNDRFVLGIRVSVPSNVTEQTWTIQNPSITLRIEFTPPTQQVIVDQKLPDNTSIDSVGLYNFSQTRFDKFSVPQTFLWDVGSNKTLQGSQKLLNYNKYEHWKVNFEQENNIVNHKTFEIFSYTNNLTSRFNPTQNLIKIKNSLEETTLEGGKVEFADPWFIDYPDPNFPKPGGGYYERNRGMKQSGPDALVFYERNSPFGPNWFSQYGGRQYKGVFLNQTPDPQNPNKPYYKVGMLPEQTITVNGQQRKFFQYKWTGSGVTFQNEWNRQTGVVFTSSTATATAILKGQLMSSDQNGISSASQRKIVRTDNGRYHAVYESMGTVWYAHSTTNDFYGAWYPDQLMLEKGKNPAIEYDGNVVKVVCEEYDPQYGGNANIWVLTFEQSMQGGWYENTDAEIIASYPNSYYGNAKPVISYTTGSSTTGEIFVAYRKNTTEGIKQRTKFYYFGWGNWTTETDIPGTNSYCINPAVIGEPGYMHIAYEYLYGVYYKFAYRQGSNSWRFDNSINLSSGSGFNYNSYPAISLSLNSPNRYVMISWKGVYDTQHQSPMPKETGGSEPLRRVAAVVKTGWGTSWGTTSNFSDNVDFTNNGSLNTVYGSIMSWSESNGQYSKYVRRRTPMGYDPITSLSTNGIHTLVSNGSELGNIKAMVFNKSTNAPYLLNRCTNDFTYIPDGFGKISASGVIDISYGRSGIIEKNGIEFVFNIGDVLLDGETIKFIERADTLPITSIEELNLSVRTDTLYLNPQSELIFSDYYYVVNSEKADSLLSNDFNINFKCELVKLSTGEAIGVFEEISYNKTNLDEYGHQGYLVDCSGIEAGDYYLRLTAAVNEEVGLSLSDIQMDNVVLNKSKLNVRNFKGESLPVDYSLEQNYPNPFNPTTTIRYQIPKDGMVTLKVYDILGAEVATLVNEEKVAGKYEVNFNASSLASGVYIYRLNVNDPSASSGQSFVNVKKMLLLK